MSNQVEMSSPWCGGGLPGPPRRPRNTGQARGLDAKPRRPAAGRAAPSAWAAKYRPPWRKAQLTRKTPFDDDPRARPDSCRHGLLLPNLPEGVLPAHGEALVPERGPQRRRLPPRTGASDAESGAASSPAAPLPSPPPTSPRPPASTPPCGPAPLRSTPFAPLPDRVRPPTEHEPKEDISTLVRPEVAPACLTRTDAPLSSPWRSGRRAADSLLGKVLRPNDQERLDPQDGLTNLSTLEAYVPRSLPVCPL